MERLKDFASPRQLEYLEAVEKYGGQRKAAKALGVAQSAISQSLKRLRNSASTQGWSSDHIQEAAKAGGISNPNQISHYWKLVKDETGNGYSIFVKNPYNGLSENISVTEMVRDAIEEGLKSARPRYKPRGKTPKGSRLLVVDLADVHFLKLCVKSETGGFYNRSVARARMIEGTKALLKMAGSMEIGRILFVMGNDILHVDNAKKTTTAGTNQDVDGTIYQGFKDAHQAVCDCIEECAKVADVDLIHNMSNHDWLSGWMLSQSVAAHFRLHPNVNATEYGMSEQHRKYYRFGNCLFGLSHGDGAKEEKLYGLMVKEARQHIGECKNLYWLLHHLHHKITRKRGSLGAETTEKDHNGMTAIIAGKGNIEGEKLNIEYVRSPSPPDGWHDRNGYVNRQGVEAFVFDPYDGQKARFTEWF